MRIDKTCSNALKIAEYLSVKAQVDNVNYPGLPNHPQHERANKLFAGQFGGILSFELASAVNKHKFINALDIILAATHLGDTRTLILPVASTIFYENGAEQRASMGISDTLLRMSIGIEDPQDLIEDFEAAFAAV
jgi:O-acetylhomoserine (thiol)-lyase